MIIYPVYLHSKQWLGCEIMTLFDKEKINTGRQIEADFAKAVCLIGMVLVHAFEEVNQIKIPYEIAPRRAGDIAFCYAATEKAEHMLQWHAEKTLEDMCRDSWNFAKNNL